jgi:tetratricopeptide (TPR) repeat protein
MNFEFTIINDIFHYFSSLKEKLKNLSETNYQLGLEHLKKGNIWEALSRFKIITFFWPNHNKALYQYAYCLVLTDGTVNARRVLEKLLKKSHDMKEAKNLLSLLKKGKAEEIQKNYKETLLK